MATKKKKKLQDVELTHSVKYFDKNRFGCKDSCREQSSVLRGVTGWQEIFCIEGLNMFMPSPVCQSGLLLLKCRS